MKKYIAVIDDEPDILTLVSIHLQKAAFEVATFEDAASFFATLPSRIPDLIILDLMLPDKDGLDVCRELRADRRYARLPIIMLTAKSQETDKVLGLELGADDYVTKPFSPKELVARVRARLRNTTDPIQASAITIGETIQIDTERYEVRIYDDKVNLTTAEFKILALLAGAPGRVYSREMILDHLWGNEKAVLDRTVDVHIRNLREKMGPAAALIKNIRGVGYKLEE